MQLDPIPSQAIAQHRNKFPQFAPKMQGQSCGFCLFLKVFAKMLRILFRNQLYQEASQVIES
jgi:hypothetical protein